MPRACVIVLDAVGAGALPDAAEFGDEGSNTLANVARAVGGLDLPTLEALGLGNVEPLEGCAPQPGAPAVAGRLLERSKGKDTTTGHWELMGVVTPHAMPTYPFGFPDEVIDPFMNRTGRGVLGNRPASGTEIIQELGEEHQKTGKWIVYTSADSVFQIAAHEDTIPLEELYSGCRVAREILAGKHAVGRVIARPFVGEPGSYERRRTATTSRSSRSDRTISRRCGGRPRGLRCRQGSRHLRARRHRRGPVRPDRTSRASRRRRSCCERSTTASSHEPGWRRTCSGPPEQPGQLPPAASASTSGSRICSTRSFRRPPDRHLPTMGAIRHALDGPFGEYPAARVVTTQPCRQDSRDR